MPLTIGSQVGPHEITALLGKGGMGEVWKALDKKLGREVAGVSLGTAGRFEEAAFTLEVAAGMSGRHTLALTCLARVLGQREKPAEANRLHPELMERASKGYVPAAHLALTAEAAGQHENAIAFARRGWDEREPPFILWARQFPQYRTLHSDPRFASILLEMDSDEEQ
jgi:hypothetical protein